MATQFVQRQRPVERPATYCGLQRSCGQGQISIFALLVFPSLFILFAMSLNIALVVHDKINLQNSVDIAAYYGAMKQAEMLNAIAHINYQIRQSWKLLTWRYRVLGSMGITDVPSKGGDSTFGMGLRDPPPDQDKAHELPAFKPSPSRYGSDHRGPYFFCVGHKHWGGLIGTAGQLAPHSTLNDELCLNMESDPIPHIPPNNVAGGIGSFMGLNNMFRKIGQFTTNANRALSIQCNLYGFNSWLLGIMSFVHFLLDQSDRKQMIKEIAQALIQGKDLDGGLIANGVEKTFEKNLSFVNKDSYNSTSNLLKQFSSVQGKYPQDLLEDQPFELLGIYSKTEDRSGCKRKISLITNTHVKASSYSESKMLIDRLTNFEGQWPNCQQSCLPSAGLKKKSLMVYYGVKAELDYRNQIFGPFPLTLKAQAFAKPFGGRIGPSKDTDNLLPPNFNDRSKPFDPFGQFDIYYAPNYSRYPGDHHGLRSRLTHSYWTKPVRDAHKMTKKITYYFNISNRDPMARQEKPIVSPAIQARKWERAAVAPDLFDVTYFTILPYYQYDYFPRLAKGILRGKPFLRGDLGTYCDADTCNASSFQGTSILQQVIESHLAGDHIKSVWEELGAGHPSLQKPAYKIQYLQGLLTAWNPPKIKYKPPFTNYSKINQTDFGHCLKWVHDVLPPDKMSETHLQNTKGKIANGCIFGGRTGYSVKMIHPDVLSSAQPPLPSHW